MPIQKIPNVLSDDLYQETVKTAYEILTIGNNMFCTNKTWQKNIVKDSFPVLIHNIYPESDLYRRLKESIEGATKLYANKSIMFYYWTRFSYIPWHNDLLHDGAITIYLNERWDKDFGGYFLYQENSEDKEMNPDKTINAVIPRKNLGVLQYGGVQHCTTPVTFDGELRITLQTFLDKDKKEQGENR